jgi:integrase/recombinase XerD
MGRESISIKSSYIGFFDSPDKKTVKKFILECNCQNLSESTIIWYLDGLKKIREMLPGKDFTDWEKDDVKNCIARVNQSKYSDWYKYGLHLTVKKFFQVTHELEWSSKQYPKMVDWIKLSTSGLKAEHDILTKEEIDSMIRSCNTRRDRALIGTLYESGMRLGELSSMKINDILWDENGCIVNVRESKTIPRPIRIIAFSGFLELYLNHRNLQSEWVWLAQDNAWRGKRMSDKSIRRLVKRIGRKARIRKNIYPHLFRHSRATELAKVLTDQQMRIYFGWSRNSTMPSYYSHLSGRDVDQKMISLFLPKKIPKRNRKLNDFLPGSV